MAEWQPIETAPKDGSKILVQMEINDDLGPTIVEWNASSDKWVVSWDGADICKDWGDRPLLWHELPTPYSTPSQGNEHG